MAHFCGHTKLIFLLLMLAQIPLQLAKPLRGSKTSSSSSTSSASSTSDLIAGNEFLKLFMDEEELESNLYSNEQAEAGAAAAEASRYNNGRSLKDTSPKENQATDSHKGKKLVFLDDDYENDENDAIIDAEARDIDLKKEVRHRGSKTNHNHKTLMLGSHAATVSASQRAVASLKQRLPYLSATPKTIRKYESRTTATTTTTTTTATATNAVSPRTTSSSSSSTRTTTPKPKSIASNAYSAKVNTRKQIVTSTPRPVRSTSTQPPAPPIVTTYKPKLSTKSNAQPTGGGDNYINRSRKTQQFASETEKEQQADINSQHQHRAAAAASLKSRTFPVKNIADTLEAFDSENQASSNIHNVLASPPLQQSASLRSTSTITSTAYNGSQRNVSINHKSNSPVNSQAPVASAAATGIGHMSNDNNDNKQAVGMPSNSAELPTGTGVEEQLLPFQTVIYHDTKEGRGPQSRSISYSSLSQNVEDIQKWQKSGIIAEARRNVSESLKPVRSAAAEEHHKSEPAKFYSQPSKMYSEPSKFYSEPAKVYSEPSKVYGEPEKFYSEPAKVYGQPSKFYSEPSKVYSQPSKVYSEPAKTYWPPTLAAAASTSSSISSTATTLNPDVVESTTKSATNLFHHLSSRKPAIVSRIAFGEAQGGTTSTTMTTTTTTTARTPFGSHFHRTYGNRHHLSNANSASSSSSSSSSSSAAAGHSSATMTDTTPRRILFNLDRLPYDLLNAPDASLQDHNKRPAQQKPQQHQSQQQQQHFTTSYLQHQEQQQQQHHINPCLESAVNSLFSSSTLSAHPALVKLRQQQQHSNQNAKGLPNGDLVKCVAQISAESPSSLGYTTEGTNTDDLYTPTPEQNFEIQESVSVMTNGRVHGIASQAGATTISPIHADHQQNSYKPQKHTIRFGVNVNAEDEAGAVGQQAANANRNNKNSYHYNKNTNAAASPDYGQYDDEDYHGGSSDDDATAGGGGGGGTAGKDEDDAKVAIVVEGRNYRKYRVEEKTDDGFIVGEYGVVDHNDGNLRGVRYTADSSINPSLIQSALLKFLSLK